MDNVSAVNVDRSNILKSKANRAYVLGIISVATCWLGGIPGLLFAIIALITLRGVKDKEITPDIYRIKSAAKTWSIIGLVLSLLATVITVIIVIVLCVAVIFYGISVLLGFIAAAISAILGFFVSVISAILSLVAPAIAIALEVAIAAIIEEIISAILGEACLLILMLI